MIEGIYTSASSMLPRTFQQVIEADNIANAQVPGHKRSNVFIRNPGGRVSIFDWWS